VRAFDLFRLDLFLIAMRFSKAPLWFRVDDAITTARSQASFPARVALSRNYQEALRSRAHSRWATQAALACVLGTVMREDEMGAPRTRRAAFLGNHLLGVSSFFETSGAVSDPFGVLGVFGAPGTLDAPGMVGFEGVAGGPIGAEPEPVPSFLGSSAPGAFVPG
jgi:hypothetical protein